MLTGQFFQILWEEVHMWLSATKSVAHSLDSMLQLPFFKIWNEDETHPIVPSAVFFPCGVPNTPISQPDFMLKISLKMLHSLSNGANDDDDDDDDALLLLNKESATASNES